MIGLSGFVFTSSTGRGDIDTADPRADRVPQACANSSESGGAQRHQRRICAVGREVAAVSRSVWQHRPRRQRPQLRGALADGLAPHLRVQHRTRAHQLVFLVAVGAVLQHQHSPQTREFSCRSWSALLFVCRCRCGSSGEGAGGRAAPRTAPTPRRYLRRADQHSAGNATRRRSATRPTRRRPLRQWGRRHRQVSASSVHRGVQVHARSATIDRSVASGSDPPARGHQRNGPLRGRSAERQCSARVCGSSSRVPPAVAARG